MAPLLGPHGAVLILDPQGKVGVVYLDFQLLAILILGAERIGDAVEVLLRLGEVWCNLVVHSDASLVLRDRSQGKAFEKVLLVALCKGYSVHLDSAGLPWGRGDLNTREGGLCDFTAATMLDGGNQELFDRRQGLF